MPRRIALIGALLLVVPFSPVAPAQAVSNDLVISQVYGGGGNTGAPYTHDFVEVFNRGDTAVSLTGTSLQYASSTGTGLFSNNPVTTLSGTLQPGQHYLVQMAGGVNGLPLPTPDAAGTVLMSATAGKVALVNSTTGLSCNGGSTLCSPAQMSQIKDLVGYGAGTNFYEGNGPTPSTSATTSASRLANGCTDTDSNPADFSVGAAAPRNTSSAATPCGAPDAAPAVASTVPGNGATMAPDGTITVTFTEPVNVTSSWFTLTCSASGTVSASSSGGPTVFSLDPPTLASGETCELTVLASSVSDQDANDPPDTMAADYVASFGVQEPCLAFYTRIPEIQGSGASANSGAVVTQGVVTGDFEGSSGLGGFYMQDRNGDGDPATSDGIFVYTGTANLVSAGQVVRVTGYARDRYGQTAINATNSDTAPVTDIRQCGSASVSATDVTLPFADASVPEQYEGMIVRLPQSLTISEYGDFDRYGEIVLAAPLSGENRLFAGTALDEPGPAALARTQANALSRIVLDDTSNVQNPAVLRHPNGGPFSLVGRFRGGDTVANTVGILGYDYSAYRIQPLAPGQYTAVNARPPVPTGGSLRVAAVNTSNYFLTRDGAGLCGPLLNMPCRGWNTPGELTRQRAKLLAALSALDADIIGLTELENTTGVEPLADLVAGLPGYAYIDTGTIGTDAIKAGVLYRAADVVPVGAFQILDATDDARFRDDLNRPVLAQTFQDKASGERLTVAVSHFKSKGSACTGDPDLGDGQGNCNVTRTEAAKALVDWLAADPTGSGDRDYLVVGDLNAYSMEDPVDALKAGPDDLLGTADDYAELVPKDGYTYLFDAQLGALDHAVASAGLAPQVVLAAAWHVNADEPDVLNYDTTYKPPAQQGLYAEDAYRFGDHDPLVVGLDLSTPVQPPPPSPPPPVAPKQAQTAPMPPKRIKKRGVTVVVPKGLKTSAGLPVTSTATKKGKVKVFLAKGALKVRTFGKKGWRVVLTQTATGTETHEPFSRRVLYVNGKRR